MERQDNSSHKAAQQGKRGTDQSEKKHKEDRIRPAVSGHGLVSLLTADGVMRQGRNLRPMKQKGRRQERCHHLLPEKRPASADVPGDPLTQGSGKNGNGDCQSCPYGRHSPCIGYCMQKILWEMREKKQSAGKEGGCLAG
ncbi:MAG: hypothetical protein HFH56_13575 [Lachnospiraceae bacterium]|jgi:hypothetical protein|nr:hypothetical protein [Lachnospiraceae bacterium]MCI9472203.1 hypothetical protein [Lachnospiraceae bacterium]